MASAVEFRTSNGAEPDTYVFQFAESLKPTAADLLFAMEGQRTRILERTAQGLDWQGQPLTPYSTNGPFYYYPGGGRDRRTGSDQAAETKRRRAAGSRFWKKTGQSGQLTSSGAIRYDSYGDFKFNGLGRSVVDLVLKGQMLQAMIVRMKSELAAVIGIYGEAAARALGHHNGNPKTRLPQRRFLAANEDDLTKMREDVRNRIVERAQRV